MGTVPSGDAGLHGLAAVVVPQNGIDDGPSTSQALQVGDRPPAVAQAAVEAHDWSAVLGVVLAGRQPSWRQARNH